MIQNGVTYLYFITCIAQSAWTILFGYEEIIASAVAMLCILFSLLVILYKQTSTNRSDGSLFEFWLLRFPFSIHAGWIVAASAVNINVVAVFREEPAATQLIYAGCGFLWVAFFAVAFTFIGKTPNYALPAVGAWATLAIAYELIDPNDLIKNTFAANEIMIIQIVAASLSGFLLLWCLGFGIRQCVTGNCLNKRSSEGDAEKTDYADMDHKE